jgi:hypothetical protein
LQALALYKEVHRQDTENVECLRYICSIMQETGDPEFARFDELYQRLQREVCTRGAGRATCG